MLDVQILNMRGSEWVRPEPPRRIFSVAVFRKTLLPLQDLLQVVLPAAAFVVRENGSALIWSGPRSWLVVGDDPDMTARLLKAQAQGLAAVTAQGDGRALFWVAGAHARDILAKLVPVDLHENVFGPDATAMTLAGHIGVQIWREDDAFILACFRSFAESLWHDLVQASAEFTGIF